MNGVDPLNPNEKWNRLPFWEEVVADTGKCVKNGGDLNVSILKRNDTTYRTASSTVIKPAGANIENLKETDL